MRCRLLSRWPGPTLPGYRRDFTAAILVDWLRRLWWPEGFWVGFNSPLRAPWSAGLLRARQPGQPIMIEVRRGLYADETTGQLRPAYRLSPGRLMGAIKVALDGTTDPPEQHGRPGGGNIPSGPDCSSFGGPCCPILCMQVRGFQLSSFVTDTIRGEAGSPKSNDDNQGAMPSILDSIADLATVVNLQTSSLLHRHAEKRDLN